MPTHLLRLPTDPFTGEPLKMARRDGRVALYSVGPDLSDDGGAPWDAKAKKGDIRLLLAP
mgnify:FL=1